jgi:putative Ca2+/H+ antiporter (TMEM165/GDT1 family)
VLDAEEFRVSTRSIYVGIIVAMLLSTIAAVTAGHLWLLFGTVPMIAVGVWMFVMAGAATPR